MRGGSGHHLTPEETLMKCIVVLRLVLVILLGLALVPARADAQFARGQKYVGAHVGLSGIGSAASLGVNGEVAYNDRIAIGSWVDTWGYGDDISTGAGNYSWDVRYFALSGTGAYHFPVASNPKIDPFLGLALGYYVVNSKADGLAGVTYSGDASRIFLGGFGGARYFFKETLSGVARLGFGASYLTVGLDFTM
jgi:hypothetical protein